MALNETDKFRASLADASSYPANLLRSRSDFTQDLERYRRKLEASDIFSEAHQSIDFLELHDGDKREYMLYFRKSKVCLTWVQNSRS
jgi:hypothetical protein